MSNKPKWMVVPYGEYTKYCEVCDQNVSANAEYTIVDCEGKVIALEIADIKSNADLIAAAPEMYEALKILAKAYEYGCGWYNQDGVPEIMEALPALLAKAAGEHASAKDERGNK